VEVERPRVRDLGERFKSKLLPMYKRQSTQVRAIIPGALFTWVGQRRFGIGATAFVRGRGTDSESRITKLSHAEARLPLVHKLTLVDFFYQGNDSEKHICFVNYFIGACVNRCTSVSLTV